MKTGWALIQKKQRQLLVWDLRRSPASVFRFKRWFLVSLLPKRNQNKLQEKKGKKQHQCALRKGRKHLKSVLAFIKGNP